MQFAHCVEALSPHKNVPEGALNEIIILALEIHASTVNLIAVKVPSKNIRMCLHECKQARTS